MDMRSRHSLDYNENHTELAEVNWNLGPWDLESLWTPGPYSLKSLESTRFSTAPPNFLPSDLK